MYITASFMKKSILTLALCALTVVSAMAQGTARKFVLKNSADGQSEITVYLPTAEAARKANGRAIVDCPGGGYSHLAMDHEGHQWAKFYNDKGIAFVVLKYRMPNGDRNIPLGDAYNAIRTVRDSAQVWNVNPHNVGIQGFSAGGHLASAVSTHAEFDARPDFSILIYPVISMDEKITHKGSCKGFLGELQKDPKMVKQWSSDQAVRRHLTPPALLIMANDDGVVPPVTNGVAYYSAMQRQGNNCELHVYPSGGHGFGFRENYKYHDRMLNDITVWLDNLKLPEAEAIRVACIGNSITDGHGIWMQEYNGYPRLLNNRLGSGYNVKNFGVSSRTLCNNADVPYTKELAWRDAKAFNPNIVIIKLGTNDSKAGNREVLKRDFQKDYQAMIDTLKALPSKPEIYVCSPIRAFKDTWTISDSVIVNFEMPVIQKLVKKNKLHYIDLHDKFGTDEKLMLTDGIHPNAKGAAKIADIVYEALISEPKKK